MHHEKYVPIAIQSLSKNTVDTTDGRSGNAEHVIQNVARRRRYIRKKFGESTHMENKHIRKLPGSTDAVRSGCNDS